MLNLNMVGTREATCCFVTWVRSSCCRGYHIVLRADAVQVLQRLLGLPNVLQEVNCFLLLLLVILLLLLLLHVINRGEHVELAGDLPALGKKQRTSGESVHVRAVHLEHFPVVGKEQHLPESRRAPEQRLGPRLVPCRYHPAAQLVEEHKRKFAREGAAAVVDVTGVRRPLPAGVLAQYVVRRALGAGVQLGQMPLEVHRHVALERHGHAAVVDERDSVRAGAQQNLLHAVAEPYRKAVSEVRQLVVYLLLFVRCWSNEIERAADADRARPRALRATAVEATSTAEACNHFAITLSTVLVGAPFRRAL
mmetsp:Transcript_12927/g.31189  ORF Transcript_12927/g.31189 Transcript_12927/m.31189 type:complete len:308 (+) Transcript_12927:473-1396(+)